MENKVWDLSYMNREELREHYKQDFAKSHIQWDDTFPLPPKQTYLTKILKNEDKVHDKRKLPPGLHKCYFTRNGEFKIIPNPPDTSLKIEKPRSLNNVRIPSQNHSPLTVERDRLSNSPKTPSNRLYCPELVGYARDSKMSFNTFLELQHKYEFETYDSLPFYYPKSADIPVDYPESYSSFYGPKSYPKYASSPIDSRSEIHFSSQQEIRELETHRFEWDERTHAINITDENVQARVRNIEKEVHLLLEELNEPDNISLDFVVVTNELRYIVDQLREIDRSCDQNLHERILILRGKIESSYDRLGRAFSSSSDSLETDDKYSHPSFISFESYFYEGRLGIDSEEIHYQYASDSEEDEDIKMEARISDFRELVDHEFYDTRSRLQTRSTLEVASDSSVLDINSPPSTRKRRCIDEDVYQYQAKCFKSSEEHIITEEIFSSFPCEKSPERPKKKISGKFTFYPISDMINHSLLTVSFRKTPPQMRKIQTSNYPSDIYLRSRRVGNPSMPVVNLVLLVRNT